MVIPKVLIADSNDEFRESLSDALSSTCILHACRSGAQALDLLQSFCPDILILDLMLPGIDGITLLHRALEADLHPAILATSRFTSDYVLEALHRLEVNYLMMKPCDVQSIVSRVNDLAADLHPASVYHTDPKSAVSNLLLSLGFPTKLDGFSYLQAAIPLYSEDPSQAITKELYAAVATLYHKDRKQVERSIRSAIDAAWRSRDEKIWQLYFNPAPGGCVPRPTNGTFISRMADFLARQIYQYGNV